MGLNFEVVNDIRAINSAELNIDGRIVKLTNTDLTRFNTDIVFHQQKPIPQISA